MNIPRPAYAMNRLIEEVVDLFTVTEIKMTDVDGFDVFRTVRFGGNIESLRPLLLLIARHDKRIEQVFADGVTFVSTPAADDAEPFRLAEIHRILNPPEPPKKRARKRAQD